MNTATLTPESGAKLVDFMLNKRKPGTGPVVVPFPDEWVAIDTGDRSGMRADFCNLRLFREAYRDMDLMTNLQLDAIRFSRGPYPDEPLMLGLA